MLRLTRIFAHIEFAVIIRDSCHVAVTLAVVTLTTTQTAVSSPRKWQRNRLVTRGSNAYSPPTPHY